MACGPDTSSERGRREQRTCWHVRPVAWLCSSVECRFNKTTHHPKFNDSPPSEVSLVFPFLFASFRPCLAAPGGECVPTRPHFFMTRGRPDPLPAIWWCGHRRGLRDCFAVGLGSLPRGESGSAASDRVNQNGVQLGCEGGSLHRSWVLQIKFMPPSGWRSLNLDCLLVFIVSRHSRKNGGG